MPMLKTVVAGTTSITNVKRYLEKAERKDADRLAEDMELYEDGALLLGSLETGRLKEYLGEGTRALAVFVSDDLKGKGDWAVKMDLARARFGHDRKAGRGKSRTYYHFVLSPDVLDACDLKTICDFAVAWVEENFRNGRRCCQYAIVVHDDNENGVIHAHIIVNATDLATGKKLHLANKEVVALQLSAQEVGKRFGLAPLREEMQETVGARTNQAVYLGRKEREVLDKGGYSWKWELRKLIADTAPLSRDFADFAARLEKAGCKVERKEKCVIDKDSGEDENGQKQYRLAYEYLVYTAKNGLKVRDSKLGAKFYLESLEKAFGREHLLEDRTYTSWELRKMSKGEVPWKEEIRCAVDAVASVAMSLPELQKELEERYGIRLIFNQRGITYQHPDGFKVRDASIGLRYTKDGLRRNAVLSVPNSNPYPSYRDILEECEAIAEKHLHAEGEGTQPGSYMRIARRTVYREFTELMKRNGLRRVEEIAPMLEERRGMLREEKAALEALRDETAERIRHETGRSSDESDGAYEERLGLFQEHMDDFAKDQVIYENYLIARSVSALPKAVGTSDIVDPRALSRATRTLARYDVRDFKQLEDLVPQAEDRLAIAETELEKAAKKKRSLESVLAAISSYREAKARLPMSLEEVGVIANQEAYALRLEHAFELLDSEGIGESAFEAQKSLCMRAESWYLDRLRERNEAQDRLDELKEAQKVCWEIADAMVPLIDRVLGEGKKSASSASGGMSNEPGAKARQAQREPAKERAGDIEHIPFEDVGRLDARNRNQVPESRGRRRDIGAR